MIQTAQIRMCDVCRLVDYDTTRKLCRYCPLCDAWICEADQNKWIRRATAMAKRMLEPGYTGDPNYIDKYVGKQNNDE